MILTPTMYTPVGMPEECMPPEKRGKLSYTIQNSKTAAKVEVLLKHKAFRVVKISVVDHNGAFANNISFC